MKPFARRRRTDTNPSAPSGTGALAPDGAEALVDLDDLDIAPLGAPNPAEDEAAEFVERLSDLDRFIGGDGARPAVPGPSGAGTGLPIARPSAPFGAVPSTGRNLPAAPIPAVAPISHARPANEPAPPRAASDEVASPVADPEDEAQEFLDRLGDLDRFIGGSGS